MNTEPNKDERVFKVTGDWKVQASKLKEKFAQLTDADLKFEVGKEHELLERMESRLKKKREDVVAIIRQINEKKFKLIK